MEEASGVLEASATHSGQRAQGLPDTHKYMQLKSLQLETLQFESRAGHEDPGVRTTSSGLFSYLFIRFKTKKTTQDVSTHTSINCEFSLLFSLHPLSLLPS